CPPSVPPCPPQCPLSFVAVPGGPPGRLQELRERQRGLRQALGLRLRELRRLCLQEAELTGKLPPEYPLEPGERPQPPPRRRSGGPPRGTPPPSGPCTPPVAPVPPCVTWGPQRPAGPHTLWCARHGLRRRPGPRCRLRPQCRPQPRHRPLLWPRPCVPGMACAGHGVRRRPRPRCRPRCWRPRAVWPPCRGCRSEGSGRRRQRLQAEAAQRLRQLRAQLGAPGHDENGSLCDLPALENGALPPPKPPPGPPGRPSPPPAPEVPPGRRSSLASPASPARTLPRSASSFEGRSVPATPVLARSPRGHPRER
ncbi:LOW QUALITY PROTEIN: coiled-coil domain-containing protein 120, partial [Acridotheres tristis]